MKPSIKHPSNTGELLCSIPRPHKQIRGYDGVYVNTMLFYKRLMHPWVWGSMWLLESIPLIATLFFFGGGDDEGLRQGFSVLTAVAALELTEILQPPPPKNWD